MSAQPQPNPTSVPSIEELLQIEAENAQRFLFGITDDGYEERSLLASCQCNCQNDAVFKTCGC